MMIFNIIIICIAWAIGIGYIIFLFKIINSFHEEFLKELKPGAVYRKVYSKNKNGIPIEVIYIIITEVGSTSVKYKYRDSSSFSSMSKRALYDKGYELYKSAK